MVIGRKLNIVELYAGTGRSCAPFCEWSRGKIALLVDNNECAAKTYILNHPNAPYLTRDLSKTSSSVILKNAGGRIDVLLGCPPCQGFSDVGARDPYDPRNSHLEWFARIAIDTKPLAIGME